MKLFNVLCGLGTAYLGHLIGKELNIPKPVHAIWLILISPYLLALMFQAMTDVLFCFVLALIYYLFLKKKFILVSLLVSLSIFSREEGIILFLIFMGIWVYKRAWKNLVLMFPLPILFHVLNLIFHPSRLWISRGYYSAFKQSVFYKLITHQAWSHLLYEGLCFDFNNLVFLVGPFSFAFFLIGLGKLLASKEKGKLSLLALIIIPILFYTFIRFFKVMDIGAIIRYETFMIPYIVLISLIGLFSNPKQDYVTAVIIGYAILIIPGFLLNGFSFYVFSPVILALAFKLVQKKSIPWLMIVLVLGTIFASALAIENQSQDYKYQEAQKISEWIKTNNATNFYYNNCAVAYVSDLTNLNAKHYTFFTPKLAKAIPAGSLVIHAADINKYDYVDLFRNESLFSQIKDYGVNNFAVFLKK